MVARGSEILESSPPHAPGARLKSGPLCRPRIRTRLQPCRTSGLAASRL